MSLFNYFSQDPNTPQGYFNRLTGWNMFGMPQQQGTDMSSGPGVLPPIDGPNLGDYYKQTGGAYDNMNTRPPQVFNAQPGTEFTPPVDMSNVNAQLGMPMRQGFKQPNAPDVPKPVPDPRSLMNFTGLINNPNIFSRLAMGYNAGGLFGALGAALTDMNANSQDNRQQQKLSRQFNEYDKAQQLRRGY